jgi:hypothetical protein
MPTWFLAPIAGLNLPTLDSFGKIKNAVSEYESRKGVWDREQIVWKMVWNEEWRQEGGGGGGRGMDRPEPENDIM